MTERGWWKRLARKKPADYSTAARGRNFRRSIMKKREFKKCANCQKGMMHSGNPVFYRVSVERMCMDVPAVQRQHGLELMFNGEAALASIMGPDEDLAKPIGDKEEVLVCQDCSIKTSVAAITEVKSER